MLDAARKPQACARAAVSNSAGAAAEPYLMQIMSQELEILASVQGGRRMTSSLPGSVIEDADHRHNAI